MFAPGRWFLLAFALYGCAGGTPVAAQTRLIDFNDLGGSGVRPVAADRYLAKGLRLETDGAGLFVFGPDTFPNTPPDWLFGSETPAGGNADATVEMRFVLPGSNTPAVTEDVSFHIADGDHVGAWAARAYDVAGTELALVTRSDASQVRFSGKPVHRVVFTPSADFDGIDSLRFNPTISPTELVFATPVPFGKTWRYLHITSGVDPAVADTDFNTTWYKNNGAYNGPAFVGPLSTPIAYGGVDFYPTVTTLATPASGSRYTTYFTTTFDIADASLVRTLSLDIFADDGAFIYLNGQLIVRHNMSAAAPDTFKQLAADVNFGGISTEAATFNYLLDPAMLVSGANFLAVSVHNQSATSTDLGFNLQISASLRNVPEPSGTALLLIGLPAAVAVGRGLAGARKGGLRAGAA